VWSDLKGASPLYDLVGEKGTKELAIKTHAEQTAVYKKIGPANFLTRAEVEKAGAPVILAAKRTTVPQQDAKYREMATKASQSAAKVTTNLFA
jgi:hypothetical protein